MTLSCDFAHDNEDDDEGHICEDCLGAMPGGVAEEVRPDTPDWRAFNGVILRTGFKRLHRKCDRVFQWRGPDRAVYDAVTLWLAEAADEAALFSINFSMVEDDEGGFWAFWRFRDLALAARFARRWVAADGAVVAARWRGEAAPGLH